jgi:hypothetical protein
MAEQLATVVGALLDAWDGIPNDLRADLEGAAPSLEKRINQLREIQSCRHCSVCEGSDHHWLEECDDDHPEGIMACKHCPATRPLEDSDFVG